jgi:hypothetical protein
LPNPFYKEREKHVLPDISMQRNKSKASSQRLKLL